MEREVTLTEILDARELRASRQHQLLARHALPLVSFTLNIAGPVKTSAAIRRAFREGCGRLEQALRGADIPIAAKQRFDAPTGCEGFYVLHGEAARIKALCIELEDEDSLGRLFDLDVLTPDGQKLSREPLAKPARGCLICGKSGMACASRRIHAADVLRERTNAILRDYFARKDAQRIAAQAVRALNFEVCTTPKPGLVDRANSGSHSDMDIFTFLSSAAAISPYFLRAAEIGQETAALSPEETFDRLRTEGLRAERAMLDATGGVNTHKGAIYSMGLLCAASGRLWTAAGVCRDPDALLAECGRMAQNAAKQALRAVRPGSCRTAGERLWLRFGQAGVRGEAAGGFPSVGRLALPALQKAIQAGASLERAGVYALLHLMAGVQDSNLAARGGKRAQVFAAQYAARLLSSGDAAHAALVQFDREMIRRNLSPGGCADLLALTYFLYFLQEDAAAL